jgi:hypothetical protein
MGSAEDSLKEWRQRREERRRQRTERRSDGAVAESVRLESDRTGGDSPGSDSPGSEPGLQIAQYLAALERRRALSTENRVNICVLMQLQSDDLPRLIQVVRLLLAEKKYEAEELLLAGNKARWGDVDTEHGS